MEFMIINHTQREALSGSGDPFVCIRKNKLPWDMKDVIRLSTFKNNEEYTIKQFMFTEAGYTMRNSVVITDDDTENNSV